MTQLEKGLPPNSVVPQLKTKVEKMKEKVSFEKLFQNLHVSQLPLDAYETKVRNSSLFRLVSFAEREETINKFSFCTGTDCIPIFSWPNAIEGAFRVRVSQVTVEIVWEWVVGVLRC